MKKTSKKSEILAIKVYFKSTDVLHMQVYNDLQELSKSTGVSLSDAAGMALRRGVPLAKAGWDDLQKTKR